MKPSTLNIAGFSVRYMPYIFACSLVLTTIMALIPSQIAPNPFNLWDKAAHALAFVVLSLSASFAYPTKTKRLYIGLLLYGAGIEVLQHTMTTTRTGETADLLADAVGVLLGSSMYFIANKIAQRHKIY
jgi:VanZ family protein